MKKIILTIALVAAAAFSANAQFRVEAIGNFADYTFTAGSITQDAAAKFGYGARAMYSFWQKKDGGLDLGLSYMMNKSYNETTRGTLTINTIQLPFHAYYDLNLGSVTITPYLGFYAGYALSGKSSFDASVLTVDADPFEGDNGLKKFDFGSDDEIIVTFGGHYNIGIGFQYGFLNCCKNSDVDVKYTNMFFLVGYQF